MKITRGKLGFDIPVQIPGKKTKIAMTPEAIAAWRTHLNLSDTGEAAKQIYIAINESNHVEIPAAIRMQILELFKRPLQLICQALKKHYIIEASVLTKQKIAIANLAQTMQLEMAYGYKLIIEDLNQHKADNKDILPNAIHNTMHYFTLVLFRCYQLYSAAPKNLWRELHLLHKFAEDKNLLKHIGNVDSTDKKTSILTTYKHAVLLAATNPFQWRQSEQEVINNSLDMWAPYATLEPYSKSFDDKPSTFIIHIDQDLPPNPLGLNTIAPAKNSIVLDLKKEVAHLKEIIAEMSSNEISARISHDGDPEYEIALATLNRLLKNWQAYITRKHKRYKVAGGMQLVFGLYAIHYYLSDEKSFDSKASNTKNAKDSKNDNASTVELPTFDAFGDEEGLGSTTKSRPSKPASSEFPIYKCTMIDVSPTGARVVIDDHSYPPVQAGEIITMRPEHSPERTYWSIGVVRWLKHSVEGNLHVGIQILAPSGIAAAAQILKDNVGAGYFLRCLLLPEMPDMDTKPSIVTPIIPFKKGKDILLYTDDHSKLLKASLTEEVDASGSYRQFEYSVQENFDNKILKKTAPNERQPDSDSEFNLLEDINILKDATKNENSTGAAAPNNKDADKKPERFDLDDL